jgi:hypothetical protein
MRIISVLGLALSCSLVQTEQLIVVTFRPYPILYDTPAAKTFAHNLQKAGKIGYNRLRSFFEQNDVISGIFCTYGGFIVVSDWFGQAVFPKLQTTAHLHLLITSKLIPIPLVGNTINHWELAQDTPADLFVIERTQDPITQELRWNIEPADIATTFTNGNHVSIDTIIVFGEPKYFFVPTGSTIEHGDEIPHFLIPPVYVKKGIAHIENVLYVLNLKHLFRKPLILSQQAPHGYSTLLHSL